MAVYKIWFGKCFFIWKGKSMLQSVQTIATLLERAQRTGTDDTNFLHHVVGYVNRSRVTKGYVEIVKIADFDDKDWLSYLQAEQNLLNAHKNDTECLNNNFVAYVPDWMGKEVKTEFDKWLKSKSKKPKSIGSSKGVHV